ncbi:hypothetical protein ACIA5E_22075 [Nocardia asteroides]
MRSNPVVEAAAKGIRRKRSKATPAAPVPTPGQLSLFDLDNLTPKAS